MLYPKISCEYKTFSPQTIVETLRNISTNNYGFIHVDISTTIIFDNLRLNLLRYDGSNLLNGYTIYPIMSSVKWVFIQKLLNQLDKTIKSCVSNILSSHPSKLLSIIDATLSFPVNYDIFCIIITNVFTSLEKMITLYIPINNKWTPFCMLIGEKCEFLVK